MDSTMIISAILAGGSFVAFALPFLNRTEKKEHYQQIIAKRRKIMFDQAKNNIGKNAEHVSASQSINHFYKMQQMLGSMGERIRGQLLQAGIRDPKAPFKYMMGIIILPFIFVLVAMMFIHNSEKELSNFVMLLILGGAALFGAKLPYILVKNIATKRTQEINQTFPDALDMLLICVQGGIGLEQAIDRVAGEVADHSEILAEELGILSVEMAMLSDRRQALQDFAKRVGSGAARSFATALLQAEQYGTSISQALRVMSEDLRDQRMAMAEQKAASLPPKLTVPMIVFFLPVLFIVILGPVAIQIRHM
jgi:tight adherence protein C